MDFPLLERNILALVVSRSWSKDPAIGFVDRQVIDAGFASRHQAMLVEFP
jgi:hypothetical protein